MTAHVFHPTILREYDVRGQIGSTLSAADAAALGRAFGSVVRRAGGSSIAVGRDGRLSSPEMEAALVEGLLSTGLTVKRVGLGPTPMLYYSVYELGCDAGVQVTGSHNPPDYNGFKMMLKGGPVYGDQIKRLGQMAAAGDFETGPGVAEQHDMIERYVARLLRDISLGRPLTVVWDPGNGAAGPTTEKMVAKLPGQHVVINAEVDGTFPAHHPDPTVEKNLVQLKAKVAEIGADLGIGFDGDGDRVGVIDGQGRVLWGDQILAILARPVLQRHPGGTIIADVKASQVLFDEIARIGGQPLMWMTGHSLIKAKMKEVHSPLAGEMSGHIFFADQWYGFDDALFAALRLLDIVAGAPESLADLRDQLPQRINTPELRFPCSEERKFQVIPEVRARLEAAGATMSTVDGVRVLTADGWWLLRASNTQDVLVARCEAADDAGLERLKALLIEQVRLSGIEPPQF